jgi:hypothetical protein
MTRSILTLVAVFAFSLSLLAQSSARPDLSGIWDSTPDRVSLVGPGQGAGGPAGSLGGIPAPGFTKDEPEMTPAAQRIYRARREGRSPTERGREEPDPSFYPYCIPRTFPRIFNFFPVIEILQSPRVVHMLFETDHQVRRIYMDGKKHLEGWHPTAMGTSYGRWDGDTLVVETENILSLDNQGWLDTFGHPHTEALRVTERIRRPTPDTLQFDFTFTDPGAYTKPWTGKKFFRLKTDVDMIDTSFCEQASQDDYLRDIRAGKPGGKQLH